MFIGITFILIPTLFFKNFKCNGRKRKELWCFILWFRIRFSRVFQTTIDYISSYKHCKYKCLLVAHISTNHFENQHISILFCFVWDIYVYMSTSSYSNSFFREKTPSTVVAKCTHSFTFVIALLEFLKLLLALHK